MERVIIVGGGVAGLSAGIYALQSGFHVTIMESHSISGGNCTSWRRKGYLFEGGMHWLVGTSKNTSHYKMWENLGVITENTLIHTHEPFTAYLDDDDSMIYLYRNPDKLHNHLLSISPADKEEIWELCYNIKNYFQTTKIQEMYARMSTLEYTQKFKSVAIRELLESLMPGHNASILFFTLATLALGDGGYIDGGSVQMTRNIVHRFKSLGGKIQNNTYVQKILIDENKAKGVLVNNRTVEADAIIVAKDTLSAVDTLFEKHLQAVWIGEMQQNTKLMMNTFICLGIESNLSDFPKNLVFHLKEPIIAAGIKYSSLSLYNYAAYEGYAPKDCTSVTIAFIGDSYDFWKNAKECGDYLSEKEKLAKIVIDILAEKLPQTCGKISVYDIATPLTYERYCGTYKGSWMSIADKGSKMRVYPNKVDNIKNLYFASQRLQAIGGLPAAAESGRNAVESLCCDTNNN